ncbi:hypothetical protein SIID45300_02244 [Candidatus Magnetaquicoccaceae bacterium FCR-1]|uniref:Uncharacterized protein n=1 Tax=Candidatus Magnetaquiglobus chichijimensis TaxID=3141448 RepID=A0ABQ0CAL8_9PROT
MPAEAHNWWIVAAASIMALIGVVNLLRTGISLLVWGLLLVAGVGGIQYGWNNGEADMAKLLSTETVMHGVRELRQLDVNVIARQAISWYQQHWSDPPAPAKPDARHKPDTQPKPDAMPHLDPPQVIESKEQPPVNTDVPAPGYAPAPSGRFR